MNTSQNPHSRAASSRRESAQAKGGFGEWTEILLFYLLPFLVFNGILFVLVASKPKINIQVANTKDYKTTTASITIESLFPVKEFVSSQEGTPLPLTETKKGQYTADIVRNGVIEIYAKALNGMSVTKYEHVNILDDVAPLVGETYSIQDGILTMALEDSQSGVDFQSVFAATPSGQTLLPLSADRQTGVLTFPMEEELLIIYANDLAGNGMQATFSTHIETLSPGAVPSAPYPAQADGTSAAENASSMEGSVSMDNTASAEGSVSMDNAASVNGSVSTDNAASVNGSVSSEGITEDAAASEPAQTAPTQQSSLEQTTSADEDEIIIHIRTDE